MHSDIIESINSVRETMNITQRKELQKLIYNCGHFTIEDFIFKYKNISIADLISFIILYLYKCIKL